MPVVVMDDSNVLQIEAIADNTYDVPIIETMPIVIPDIDIIKIPGEIREEKQEDEYPFQATENGIYRFEFSDVPDGTDLGIRLCNSGKEELKSDYSVDNGEGITASLTAGETYYIEAIQYKKYGTYTLNIGHQKPATDLNAYTKVSDSIQYTDQENDYLFVPEYTDSYRFELTNVPAGMRFSIIVYNSGWEELDSRYNLGDGEEITRSLVQGKSYYVQVRQYNGLGAYTVNIKRQS